MAGRACTFASGTELAKAWCVGEVCSSAGATHRTSRPPRGGSILTGLVLGAIGVFVIERDFVKASAFALSGAVPTYFGFMHGEAVGIGGGLGVTPAVALACAVVAAGFFAAGSTAPALPPFRIRKSRLRRPPNERAKRRSGVNLPAGPPRVLISGCHVPQSRRAAQQHAAAFARNDRPIAGHFGKSKRHEILDDGSVQRATVRYGHTNRL